MQFAFHPPPALLKTIDVSMLDGLKETRALFHLSETSSRAFKILDKEERGLMRMPKAYGACQ
ncbi:MAG: hypothetical protein QOD00_2501 [Blastocatellia bacterium]|jgi:hypothetical protein|nr:hypothetical protein [Blastocatellia bacterium]